MPDIFHDLPIKAAPADVFDAVSRPAGLDQWWTKASKGEPSPGADYELDFGPGHRWRAKVTRCTAPTEFELELTDADSDWLGTRVGVELEPRGESTWVRFHHTGWPSANEHYRVSCSCWAMYLRVLRRYLEYGETVPYEKRLDV